MILARIPQEKIQKKCNREFLRLVMAVQTSGLSLREFAILLDKAKMNELNEANIKKHHEEAIKAYQKVVKVFFKKTGIKVSLSTKGTYEHVSEYLSSRYMFNHLESAYKDINNNNIPAEKFIGVQWLVEIEIKPSHKKEGVELFEVMI